MAPRVGVNLLRNSMKVCKAALAAKGWVQGQEGDCGGFDQVGHNFMLGFSPLSLNFGPHPSQCKCRAGRATPEGAQVTH